MTDALRHWAKATSPLKVETSFAFILYSGNGSQCLSDFRWKSVSRLKRLIQSGGFHLQAGWIAPPPVMRTQRRTWQWRWWVGVVSFQVCDYISYVLWARNPNYPNQRDPFLVEIVKISASMRARRLNFRVSVLIRARLWDIYSHWLHRSTLNQGDFYKTT